LVKNAKRVGIDFHVAHGIYQGVRTYLTNLIEAMLKMSNELDYFVYTRNAGQITDWPGNNHSSLKLKRLPSRYGPFNLSLGFPLVAIRDSLALFHSQYILPVHLPCKSVLTIHDILFESHPEFFPAVHRTLIRFLVPFSGKHASRIISVSEFTKRQIMEYYRIPEEKIEVIYEGASPKFRPIKNGTSILPTLKAYGIEKKYILFVGRIEPRKNIVSLLKAFDYIKKRGRKDLCLVIVGNQDKIFQENESFEKVEEMQLGSDVIFTGGVSEDDLIALYNGAEVLTYPAFAEGFGLPVLEAMACGTPVVTSHTSALPEVAGEAALLINPYSFHEIGEAVEGLLDNQHLRKKLSAKGIERARRFSWERTAEKTVEVYRNVMQGRADS
jgi:glycosyltransferase involved in cell wall biosynthesis